MAQRGWMQGTTVEGQRPTPSTCPPPRSAAATASTPPAAAGVGGGGGGVAGASARVSRRVARPLTRRVANAAGIERQVVRAAAPPASALAAAVRGGHARGGSVAAAPGHVGRRRRPRRRAAEASNKTKKGWENESGVEYAFDAEERSCGRWANSVARRGGSRPPARVGRAARPGGRHVAPSRVLPHGADPAAGGGGSWRHSRFRGNALSQKTSVVDLLGSVLDF